MINVFIPLYLNINNFYFQFFLLICFQSSILTIQGFWVANAMLYGCMFGYIYACVSYQLSKLRQQVTKTMLHSTKIILLCEFVSFTIVKYCKMRILFPQDFDCNGTSSEQQILQH